MNHFDRVIKQVINEEVSNYIYTNLKHKIRHCLNCNSAIRDPRNKYHHFCSKKCYQRKHRLKGFVVRIVDHKD